MIFHLRQFLIFEQEQTKKKDSTAAAKHIYDFPLSNLAHTSLGISLVLPLVYKNGFAGQFLTLTRYYDHLHANFYHSHVIMKFHDLALQESNSVPGLVLGIWQAKTKSSLNSLYEISCPVHFEPDTGHLAQV